MKRLIPIRSSRDITNFDEEGRPESMVVRVEYEMREVSDAEYYQALEEIEKIFPVAWKKDLVG